MANGEAVALGDLKEMIRRDDAAGASHVFDHKTRLPRDMFAHVPGDRARVNVVAAACRQADDDANCLPLVKITLPECMAEAAKKERQNQHDQFRCPIHDSSLSLL